MDSYLQERISADRLAELGLKNGNDSECQSPAGNIYLNHLPLNEGKSQETATTFDYIAHYTADHETFDYFENSPCAAQVDDERRVHERILETIPENAKHILDVGCGGAWLAKAMKNSGREITSMDLSHINVEKALDKLAGNWHHGIVADSVKHPFRNGAFDCIIASEVIEHVPDPKIFLASLATALSDNGSIIITTPYKEHIIHETCIHCNHATPRNAHLHSFDEKILTSISPTGMKAEYQIFGNKALMKLRTHNVLGWISPSIYKKIDSMANTLINKPAHIMITYRKI